MQIKINITCSSCSKTHEVNRTNEIPENVISMGCNWCPECEATEEYEEWYNYSDDSELAKPDDVPSNQLLIAFCWEELGFKSLTIEEVEANRSSAYEYVLK